METKIFLFPIILDNFLLQKFNENFNREDICC